MTGKQERIATLEQRLQDGFLRIGAAMQQGLEVDNWHTHWQNLLAEYVKLNDELASSPPTQQAMPGLPRAEAA
jgi:hypothetical protein